MGCAACIAMAQPHTLTMCTIGVVLLSAGKRDRNLRTMNSSALRTEASYRSRSMPGLKSTAAGGAGQVRGGRGAGPRWYDRQG